MNDRVVLLAIALLLAGAATVRADDAAGLREEIEAADATFFGAVFDTCDVEAVASMVSDDFEFFHDKWGQIANSKEEFVEAIRGGCERQRQGTDFKARRQLLPASLAVFPMTSYGALETGNHAFFRVEADGRLTPTEHAKFTHLWRRENDKWLLARVLSYAHVDGPAPNASTTVQSPEGSDHE